MGMHRKYTHTHICRYFSSSCATDERIQASAGSNLDIAHRALSLDCLEIFTILNYSPVTIIHARHGVESGSKKWL
jgi:hypothetical protein